MLFREKTFAQATVNNSISTVFTAARLSVVKYFIISNRSSSTTARVKIYGDTDGTSYDDSNLLVNILVPANDSTFVRIYFPVEAGGTISAIADVANCISLTVCGAEV